MKQLLARMRVPVKILTVIAMISLVTLVVTWIGASSLDRANREYSELTLGKLPSTAHIARLNRLLESMPYAGYRAVAYDGNSPMARQAQTEEKQSYTQAKALLDEIEHEDASTRFGARSTACRTRRPPPSSAACGTTTPPHWRFCAKSIRRSRRSPSGSRPSTTSG